MPPAKEVRAQGPAVATELRAGTKTISPIPVTDAVPIPLSRTLAGNGSPTSQPLPRSAPVEPRRENGSAFQPRVPVIVGEAMYRGWMPVDGTISGQLGGSASAITIKQRPKGVSAASEPELNGELRFKELLRVNGHIAGRIVSEKGTLIVATEARVDAEIEAGVVMISGTVNGNIIGHERVELGPAARIVGNISTTSLTVKPGAVFQGDCLMPSNGKSVN